MTPERRRIAIPVAVATLALAVLLAVRPLPADRIAAGYVLALAAIGLAAFTRSLSSATSEQPASQFDRMLTRPAEQASRPPELVRIEREITLGAAIVVLAGRHAKKTPRVWRLGRGEALSLALDESLDDLRNDPDLRRAIVAAYARMEAALAHAGLPRRPAEAPFEYLERALTTLDTSAGSVRRLTALFEWAKFSHHEPDPAMRDEAVDALVAVRDELRAPAEEQVPA